MALPFNISLVQNSFTDGAFLVSSDTSFNCYKYDIRVVANDFNQLGKDAIATNTVINDFTITSTQSSFAIPINPGGMRDGTRYKVTIRLYPKSNPDVPYSYTTPGTQLFYYDTRDYAVAPSISGPGGVLVSSMQPSPSEPLTTLSRFDITNVQVFRTKLDASGNKVLDGSGNKVMEVIPSNDFFFNDVGVSAVVMSCTTLVKNASNKFNTGTEYSLGSKIFNQTNSASTSYNFDITSDMNQAGTDMAYELWGYLTLSQQFTFGITIVANDNTIGYVIKNPLITVELRDVIDLISENPISITLTNWSHYSNYNFDSLTLNIYDASSNLQLRDASNSLLTYTKSFSAFNEITDSNGNKMGVVHFSRSDLNDAMNETPLKNGVKYTFKTSLDFVNTNFYKPSPIVRSAVAYTGEFSDLIVPIDSSGNAVNSWEMDPTKTDGLVVRFKKTNQFYGGLSRPYNLEGNTKVKAEYRTFDTSGNKWQETWSALSGGSISQSTVTYSVNPANTDGEYLVPVYNADEKRGNAQPPVYIYATIPGNATITDQAKYSAVQIRLRLITTNAAFSTKTSTDYNVPRVDGTTYKNNQVVDNNVTFRYHPKPVAHDFATDKPICTSAGASISFDVPLTVYPFFTAVVSAGCNGIVTNITNPNAYDASWNQSVAHIGQGLSYTPAANASFTLKVKYVSSENSAISVETPMTVQQQGFPSSSFSITSNSCRWNKSTQQIDYALAISANSTSADRMDGWNMYTSTTDASGNLLSDASGNLSRDASGNLLSDASGNVYTLQQYNKLKSGSLTQSVTLANVTYPDYKNIAVTFVATRSLYLDPANFDKQVETVGAGLGDTKQTLVTKLPDVLPRINTSAITLENTVYNFIGTGTQYATLKATRPSNANGLRLKNTDSNTSDVDMSGNFLYDISYNIPLSNSTLERSYDISARYYSVDTPTLQYVDSLPVTVTFKNSTSNRSTAPVITSKTYSDSKFTVTYDISGNTGSWLNSNTQLLSNVYVNTVGLNNDTLVGLNDGSVDISVFNGDNVNMYVQDKFTTTYTVTPEVTEAGGITNVNGTNKTSVQPVNSLSSEAFYLAANPQIVESSIVVDGSHNVVTVNVKNMGAPYLNNAMLVVSQDSTIDEDDHGYYALAYFNNSNGFTSSVVETNKIDISGNATNDISGNALRTLAITESGTGMTKITTLTFSSINLVNKNPVNLVLLVRNTNEGSDSCAVANKAIVYPYSKPVLAGVVAFAPGSTDSYTATATYTFNTNVSAIKVMKSDGTTIIASQAVSLGTAPIVIPYTDADISKSFYVVALGNSFAPESQASAYRLYPYAPPVFQSAVHHTYDYKWITATYTFNTNVSAVKVMRSNGTTYIPYRAVSSGTATIDLHYTIEDYINNSFSFYVIALGNSFATESIPSKSLRAAPFTILDGVLIQ